MFPINNHLMRSEINQPQRWLKKMKFKVLSVRASNILLGALALLWLSGCANAPTLTRQVQDFGHPYKPSNIYSRTNLPDKIRRIAVLPVTVTSHTPVLESGLENLVPVLYAELEKSKRFEIVPVTREQMSQLTGQPGWRIDEQLPPNLFARIKDLTGCDALLFSQLTRYQPYPPPAIGWKFNLIECPRPGMLLADGLKGLTIWSADELLDAGDPAVANGARAYYMDHLRNEIPLPDPEVTMSSPTRFGQYTVSTLLATLPERPKEPAKPAKDSQ